MQKFKMPALKVQTPLSYFCMQIKLFSLEMFQFP